MLARARAVAGKRSFRNTTFELADIPVGDSAADVCLLFNALHCVPDPPGAVAEVTRCLAPGGHLIGSMLIRDGSPRADRLLTREAARPNGTAGPGGTLDDLEQWLHQAQLTAITTTRAGAMAVFDAERAPGPDCPPESPAAR